MANAEVVNRTVKLADCKAHPGNYQKHGELQVKDLARSLRKFGQVRSIVVQDAAAGGYVLVAGHGLAEAAKLARMRELRADVIPADWPEVKVLAYLAADNELARGADPDEAQLAALVAQVQAVDADLAALAAGGDERLAEMLAGLAPKGEDPGAQVDKAAELQEKWQTAPGQLWELGEHRLICGDCREPATWERLLAGVKANGVFTSPPYAEQRKEQYGGVPTDEYVAWWEAVQTNVKANLAGDGSFFVNIKPHCEDGERVLYVFDLVLAMRRQWGWRFVDELYWRKLNVPPVDVRDVERFPDAIEYIFHWALGKPIRFNPDAVRIEYNDAERENIKSVNAKRRGRAAAGDTAPKYSITGSGYHESITQMSDFGRLPHNVLDAATSSGVVHAAAFPVALPDFFIRAYSDAGDVWLDPFCGSGTTIMAADQNGRRGYGIEMLPKYCAVILERWSVMTGKTPVLVSDG